MSEKTIGIVGGMGPEATLDCFGKIVNKTPAQKDQEHLRVVIDSNPKVPDRTAAIVGDGESPVPTIVKGCQVLERAGADFIIIPCVSAHFFIDDIRQQSPLPVLSIIDAVTDTIKQEHPEIGVVGLMGTTGTIKGQKFQKCLAEIGINTLVPDEHMQARIMAAIYDIKNAKPPRSREEITTDLIAGAQSLIDQKPRGAQGIVAGCTEIPLALRQEHLPVPYFDALTILARAAIKKAGLTPAPLK
ncbi:MAG: amino acid racemase [Desulfobacterales bacterium]|jgi:aspartate racemase